MCYYILLSDRKEETGIYLLTFVLYSCIEILYSKMHFCVWSLIEILQLLRHMLGNECHMNTIQRLLNESKINNKDIAKRANCMKSFLIKYFSDMSNTEMHAPFLTKLHASSHYFWK